MLDSVAVALERSRGNGRICVALGLVAANFIDATGRSNSFGTGPLRALTLPSQLTWLILTNHIAASKEAISGKHMPRGNTSFLLGFWSSPKFSLQTSSSKGHGRVIQIVLYVIKRAWPCDSNCPLCDQELETAPHLCVHCVFSS